MNILCPGCQSSINVDDITLKFTCRNCGLESDLSGIGTFPGTLSVPVIRDLSGETINNYEIQELIGIGGMGIVYKAIDVDSGLPVAMKVLNHDVLMEKEFVSRFQREALALKQLDHPNIVKVLDSGKKDTIYYIVTELLEGKNLAEYLKTTSPEPPEILRIMQEVCSAIRFAHEKGIIHRDLKPANIFITETSVKILDFGLARLTAIDTRFSSFTRTDIAMGTINYLSPEQRTNAKTVDERSDIFSLGVIFYEMLTGTIPVGRFSSPSKSNRNLSKKFDTIIEKCLDSNPNHRYPSVSDLQRAVDKLVRGPIFRKRFMIAAAIVIFALISHDTPLRINPPQPNSFKTKKHPFQVKNIPVPDRLPHELTNPHIIRMKHSAKNRNTTKSFPKNSDFKTKK